MLLSCSFPCCEVNFLYFTDNDPKQEYKYVMQRITAEDALNHEWFREVPLPKSKDFMPTFPAQHAQDR